MATQSLLAYLQNAQQDIPRAREPPGADQAVSRNTMSPRYNFEDIATNGVGVWTDFNITTVMQSFGTLLQSARLPADAYPGSPPPEVRSEHAVSARVFEYISPRIRRALRFTFNHMNATNQMGGRTQVFWDVGELARLPDTYKPDLSFFDGSIPLPANRPNRLPGDIKPSAKWTFEMGTDANALKRREFRQVLSQVNYYMFQHGARYGYILTERELVAVKRLTSAHRPAHLELSQPIPWIQRGTEGAPQMSILLALWYLGMLASSDADWPIA